MPLGPRVRVFMIPSALAERTSRVHSFLACSSGRVTYSAALAEAWASCADMWPLSFVRLAAALHHRGGTGMRARHVGRAMTGSTAARLVLCSLAALDSLGEYSLHPWLFGAGVLCLVAGLWWFQR